MFEFGKALDGDPHFKYWLTEEYVNRSQYEKHHTVQEGDVVLDIGASIGPFLYSIKDNNPSKVIAVEPISAYHKTLNKNAKGLPLKLYKNAIGDNDNHEFELEWSCHKENVKSITFNTILKENNLEYIDYLKTDCEGGEYHIFTEEHIKYLKNNVGYIVGEFHLNTKEMTNSFRKVYELLKKENFKFKVDTVTGDDITQILEDNLEEQLINKQQLILYIDNRPQKLLYIAPHLSTGGLPQYLVKKIELIKDNYEVYVVEYSDHGGNKLVVQKNKILSLIDDDKFYTLYEDKEDILNIINDIQPNIIHLEEIPEYFMDYDIAKKIYSPDRNYNIVETSHDSSMNTDNKLFFPDKFMFVSDWQIKQYNDIDIPKVLVEYPIEYKERPDRTKALNKLGLDPSKKHILHVGLFTPRKNQAEFFEFARKYPWHQFHCVGNQAGNFKHYWEPLMKNKPDNLTWWDERKDVDNFYSSMDLFLFTSRGSANDKETMPLVIREAMSWNMNLMIYNLGVYLNYFDKFDNVHYLDFEDMEKNYENFEKLAPEEYKGIPVLRLDSDQMPIGMIPNEGGIPTKFDTNSEVFIISTYPTSDNVINTTKECIKSLKKLNRILILTSHAPIPKSLQELVDYSIYDSDNILTKHTYYARSYGSIDIYDYDINLTKHNNNIYHGPSVYTNYYNGVKLAKSLNIKNVFFLNFDYILKNNSFIDDINNKLLTHKAYLGKYKALEGNTLETFFLGANIDYLDSFLPKINNAEEYNNLMNIHNSESNGLENLFYHMFKNEKNIYRENQDIFKFNIKENFTHKDFSRCEYYTILPCTNMNGYFSPFIEINNLNDKKIINYIVNKNNEENFINRTLYVNGKFKFWDLIKYNKGDNFIISIEVLDGNNKTLLKNYKFKVNQDYMDNEISTNGSFTWKGNKEQYLK